MVERANTAREFLMAIADEEGIRRERMETVVKKLEEEWYDTVDSMRNLTLEQLQALGVPSRVATSMLRKLQGSPVPVSRGSLLTRLRTELANTAALQECVRTLQAIVYNLVVNPDQLQLRTIKQSNPKFHDRVGRFATALSYLEQVPATQLGFKSQGDSFTITDPSPPLLHESLSELNALATQLGLPAKEASVTVAEPFNPYKAVTISLRADAPRLAGRENDPAVFISQIEELNRAKEEALRREVVPRCPQVYRLSRDITAQSIRRRNEVLAEATDEGDTPEDDSLMLQTMQSLLRTNEENSRFQNKRKKMLEQLARRKVFTRVTVQVRFPDHTMFQGQFSPLETNVDLYKFVHGALEQTQRKFYLYFTPPKTRVPLSRFEKLESMAPASLLYFAWEQEGMD